MSYLYPVSQTLLPASPFCCMLSAVYFFLPCFTFFSLSSTLFAPISCRPCLMFLCTAARYILITPCPPRLGALLPFLPFPPFQPLLNLPSSPSSLPIIYSVPSPTLSHHLARPITIHILTVSPNVGYSPQFFLVGFWMFLLFLLFCCFSPCSRTYRGACCPPAPTVFGVATPPANTNAHRTPQATCTKRRPPAGA